MQECIRSKKDLILFQESESFAKLTSFVRRLCEVRNSQEACRKDVSDSPFVRNVIEYLGVLELRAGSYGANYTGRYGNPQFRSWHKVAEGVWGDYSLKIDAIEAREELSAYISSSFGNPHRIDYGTGHELNFVCFLFCATQHGLFQERHFGAVANQLMNAYFCVCKSVQRSFRLEPAGSMGVWGLDDYNFLPFLMGACELQNHTHLKPCSVRNRELVADLKSQYLYFQCISELISSGMSLRMRSPLLDDISAAKSWDKVYSGLWKLYIENVLMNLQVMQHFLFGNSIRWEHEIDGACSIAHEHFATCCVKSLPSIHASEVEKPIPYD